MKRRTLIAAILTTCTAGALVASDPARQDLVVHEWGTFLAMNGSDGVTLDGMYHEEHALPPFVHARSRDQLRLRSSNMKGETPVIYFYTPRPMRVYVHVGFPQGLWTQWYPQASMVGPGLAQAGSPPRLRNGRIDWNLDLVPPSQAHPKLPDANSEALWHYSRDVDAAYVTTAATERHGRLSEWERFIFYRGLGEARLPIDARLSHGRIMATSSGKDGLKHLFVLRVENGRGAFDYIPSLADGAALDRAVPEMSASRPLDEFVAEISDALAARLVESGLYEKEARAMVNTWKSSYFKADGVRVLFVLPQSWTDRFIPIKIDPQPAQLVRVMVGRLELLDAEREAHAERAILDLASPDAAARERAFAALRGEGRYVEPIVRRTLATTTDERARALARRLLLTDFVTELRTAVTNADTGEPVLTDPVFVRAQLASLLRDVGLVEEARQEGVRALAELERGMERGVTMTRPNMTEHQSRHTYRALARAHEGAGHDAEALMWYGEFVRFGSQSAAGAKTTCVGCHSGIDAPTSASWFRDWYAGRKFAEYAKRTGETERLIAAHEANIGTTAARLSLAFLYESRGQEEKARAMWELLER